MSDSKKRVIDGIIKTYSRKTGITKTGRSYYQIGVLMENDDTWHKFLFNSLAEANNLLAIAPEGSHVRYVETLNQGYWNYEHGSMVVVKYNDRYKKFENYEKVLLDLYMMSINRFLKINIFSENDGTITEDGLKLINTLTNQLFDNYYDQLHNNINNKIFKLN